MATPMHRVRVGPTREGQEDHWSCGVAKLFGDVAMIFVAGLDRDLRVRDLVAVEQTHGLFAVRALIWAVDRDLGFGESHAGDVEHAGRGSHFELLSLGSGVMGERRAK